MKIKISNKIKMMFLLLCAICVSITAVFAVKLTPQTASADTADTADTAFDISGTNGTGFNSENLKILMGKITGKEKSSYNELKAYMYVNSVKTGSQIDAVVKLNGRKWNVVYASETKSGDVIATLWLAEKINKNPWNGWFNPSVEYEYPSNLYYTSMARSYLVGSSCSTGGNEAQTLQSGVQIEEYAKLIVDYGEYMVTPSEVAYQENESAIKVVNATAILPNEAYGTPSPIVVENAEYDYSNRANYNIWQYDKLWLPSYSEIGSNLNESTTKQAGIWGVSPSVRAGYEGFWLRSGANTNAAYAYYVEEEGAIAPLGLNLSCAICPAFHLNLKTAAAAAGLTVEAPEFAANSGVQLTNNNTVASATYSNNLTFNLTAVPAGVSVCVDAAEVAGSSFTVKEAGTHVVTMTPKEGYSWADGSLGAKTLTVVVEKAAFDMSAVKWSETTEFTEDGTLHKVYLTGLPAGVTAIYSDNSASVAGSYTATANFIYDSVNYSAPNLENMSCAWTVKAAEPATPVDPTQPTGSANPTDPSQTETIVVAQSLSGGAIAAIVVCAFLAVVAIVTAVTAIVFKKTRVIYDGGFYDDASDQE